MDFCVRKRGLNVTRVAGKDHDEYSLQGVVAGANSVQSVQVEARVSATAFDSLAKSECDIGMSSRKIKPAEQAALVNLGDMTSPACEHVLALDGIAIVVHKSELVPSLSRKQLQAIFSGQTKDGSQVGGRPGAIALLARTTVPALTTPLNPLFCKALRFRPMRNALEIPQLSLMPWPQTLRASGSSACLCQKHPRGAGV